MKLENRLKAIMRDGNLTIADLARWFKRPHPTVRGWVNGVGIGGAPQDREAIECDLMELEGMVGKKNRLPIPRLSPSQRIAYLKDLRRG